MNFGFPILNLVPISVITYNLKYYLNWIVFGGRFIYSDFSHSKCMAYKTKTISACECDWNKIFIMI